MPHLHEIYDFTVAAYIVHDDKVLLVKHPRYGLWLPVGGHIEHKEDPLEALYREVAEESGLTVEFLPTTIPALRAPGSKALPTPHFMDVHEANPPHRHISLTYFMRASNNQAVLSTEHSAQAWLGAGDLSDPAYGLKQDIVYYCRQALAAAKS